MPRTTIDEYALKNVLDIGIFSISRCELDGDVILLYFIIYQIYVSLKYIWCNKYKTLKFDIVKVKEFLSVEYSLPRDKITNA